jgi:hypothetical protein
MENSVNKIPTHDPYTGELNPYYEELTGERNPLLPEEDVVIPTFDMKGLVGKKFRYKGDYGISTWTDKVKAIRSHNSIEFEVPIKFGPPKENGLLNPLTSKIIGMKYKFFVVSERSEQNYEFEDCIFLLD